MNKLSVVAAALFTVAFAGAAVAQTAPLNREAVVADLVAARANGELAALQAEKGVEARPQAAVVTAKLPAQAVYARSTTAARWADVDHGENAARELGDFSAAITPRRAPVVAGR